MTPSHLAQYHAIVRNPAQSYAITQKLTFSTTKIYTVIWRYIVSFIYTIQVHKTCKPVQNINI